MKNIPKTFKDRSICIVGLGYVGMTLATVMADQGFSVLGVEIRDEVLRKLDEGEPHIFEPGLRDYLARIKKQGTFQWAKHIPSDCTATVFIITVGTPLGHDRKVRLDMIENVTHEVAKNLKDGDLVILRSTVKFGTTRKNILPILQKTNRSFDLAFCPERTIEGQALSELRALPQIVGGFTAQASMRAAQIFQFITPSVVQASDLETAEMIKLLDNAHRDITLAYGNEVALMCDAAGISASEVIRLGKLGYMRTNIALPGPVGGPCLEKDSHILAEGMAELGLTPEITLAARRVNENQPREVIAPLATMLEKVKNFPSAPIITMLGIAFKGRPLTDDLRGTMARPILDELKKRFPKALFRGYDSVVPPHEIEHFGLAPAATLEDAFKGSHLIIIANNHPEFADMPILELTALCARPALIYDFWNNFTSDDLSLPEGVGYMALGSHKKAILPSLL